MNQTIAVKPIFKPDISFEARLEEDEEKQTIVHCHLFDFSKIRIWPTTFLIQEDGSRKELLHAYNIPAYPVWKDIFGDHRFTLVFTALDAGCKLFDLLEDITEEGNFHVRNIHRNSSDVYNLEL